MTGPSDDDRARPEDDRPAENRPEQARPGRSDPEYRRREPAGLYDVVVLLIDRLCELVDKVLLLEKPQPFLRLFAVLALVGLVVVLVLVL